MHIPCSAYSNAYPCAMDLACLCKVPGQQQQTIATFPRFSPTFWHLRPSTNLWEGSLLIAHLFQDLCFLSVCLFQSLSSAATHLCTFPKTSHPSQAVGGPVCGAREEQRQESWKTGDISVSGAVVTQGDHRDVLAGGRGSWERNGECDGLPGGRGQNAFTG